MSDFLDKITKIDDILRENAVLLNSLIDEQRNTNNYLRSLLNKKFVDIDLTLPESIGGDILKNLNYMHRTITHKFPNQVIASGETYTILKGEFTGMVAEIMIRSSDSSTDNKDYSFRIKADDEIIYDDTWDNYAADNSYVSDVSAFDDGTNYLLIFNTIAFTRNVEISFHTVGAEITFGNIFIKYHKRIT